MIYDEDDLEGDGCPGFDAFINHAKKTLSKVKAETTRAEESHVD